MYRLRTLMEPKVKVLKLDALDRRYGKEMRLFSFCRL
jgi:hypothetical protein